MAAALSDLSNTVQPRLRSLNVSDGERNGGVTGRPDSADLPGAGMTSRDIPVQWHRPGLAGCTQYMYMTASRANAT